jgi:hypothetical protein
MSAILEFVKSYHNLETPIMAQRIKLIQFNDGTSAPNNVYLVTEVHNSLEIKPGTLIPEDQVRDLLLNCWDVKITTTFGEKLGAIRSTYINSLDPDVEEVEN